MSMDDLSISHVTQARSSPDPLPKATPAESTMWDIEIEQSSLLSPALPSEKRSVMLEIRNRPWNGSPASEPNNSHHTLARSPRSETLPEKSDNLIEPKSPSPSLGPSQSASQHGRFCPCTDRTIPLADSNSKYFIPQISKAAPTEQQVSLEKQPFHPDSVFLPKQMEKITPAGYLDAMSPENRFFHPCSFDNLADTSNLIRYLDMQVTQHNLAPQHRPDPEIAPCFQPSLTDQICSWQPVSDVDVEDVGLNSCNDSELIDPRCAVWWDSERSVDHYTQNSHLLPSVDYDNDLYPLEHDGRDVPEVLVSRQSRAVYDAHEYYLYHDYGESGETNVVAPEYGLIKNSEAGPSDECMMDNRQTADNGHEYDEYFGDRQELDDAWDQCHSEIFDGKSHISLWNRESTSSNDLDNSSLDDPESIHPAAMFSQGRALLLGSTQQFRDMTTAVQTRSRLPLLSLAEADVAKSLRNHWLPQKL
jgi:hypothetical protein